MGRRGISGAGAVAACLVALAGPPARALAADSMVPVSLAESVRRGAFNVGPSKADVALVGGPGVYHQALKIDYSLPEGTAAGVWAKGFPPRFGPDGSDVVIVAARVDEAGQALDVAASLEIKGSAGTQRIPLSIATGRVTAEHALDWRAIGSVVEVVVSIVPGPGRGPVTGSLYVDATFEAIAPGRKLAASPVVRVGAAMGMAGVVLAVASLVAVPLGRKRGGPAAGVGLDAARGAGVVGIVGLAAAAFNLGARGGWDVGWTFLALAGAGVAVGEWWSYGSTGRHLSSGEAGRDALVTGLLAASSSPIAILQAPSSWSEMLTLSQTAAAAAVLVYHAANARRLAREGKHLGAVAGALIVGTPYLFGGLVVLSNPDRVRELGAWLTFGLAGREWVGRVAVLFAFNVAIAQALGMATKRRPFGSIVGHLALLAVAAGAVAAPMVADLGSGPDLLGWPAWSRPFAAILAAVLSQGGLWAEVYLVTGLFLDALRGSAPTGGSTWRFPGQGLGKGMVYAGVFMALLHAVAAVGAIRQVQWLVAHAPAILGLIGGAAAFPLVKTIFETFDGSQGFFRRAAKSYRDPALYIRGAVVGLGVDVGRSVGVPTWEVGPRAGYGFAVGVAAYAGVDRLLAAIRAARLDDRPPSPRVSAVQGLLGGFIGAALGFYFDAAQVAVVVAKFHRYLVIGGPVEGFDARPFLEKWGRIDLGTTAGGVKLLFDESLRGVIAWAVPAWLFAINRTFLAAYFRKEATPIRALFTPEGRAGVMGNMIEVLRWGLWMSPIINSFLRPMGEPTWYNQDGAIRTVLATFEDATRPHDAFRDWSLRVFTALLAYDSIRVLIWLDHMGLRVATLVNLSFLGMDRLDGRLARFLSPAATARCIPEGVKRFTTWAPLLIPFYIPRGADWDRAWGQSGAGNPPASVTVAGSLLNLPVVDQALWLGGFVFATTAAFTLARRFRGREAAAGPASWTLANPEYAVDLKDTGEVIGRVLSRGFDLTRRSYDGLDPAGRALFIVDEEASASFPVVGNFPGVASRYGKKDDALTIEGVGLGVRASVAVTLAAAGDAAEVWTITVANPGDTSRRLKLVPYIEWVLNRPDADRGHTQYNRLFAEMEYSPGLHAVLAWDKHAKAMGVLASDAEPEGFLTSRMDFIGRARGLRSPRVLETLAFSEAGEVAAHPTFDPIASLCLGLDLKPRESRTIRLLIGHANDKAGAVDLVARHLAIPGARAVSPDRERKTRHAIGHGEIPPGTPQPYSDFLDDGRTLRVLTPFTPRPYDHVLSNALGHVVALTNRGFQTTSSGNSQQNRVTPDWSDTVTREVPPEAFYLFDPDSNEWFSPTYHPLNDPEARHLVDFGVDGTAVYRMSKGSVETELTVFVPPDEPAGVYRLVVRNHGPRPRRFRFAPYFQVVLAAQPEHVGPLQVRHDPDGGALFFENPRNTFREGPAFAAVYPAPEVVETNRGRFFGLGRDVARPAFVEHGQPTLGGPADDRPIAAFLVALAVPAHGETTAVVILGQADDRATAEAILRRHRDPLGSLASWDRTRKWWTRLLATVHVETDRPEFDHYLAWLRYQGLAERIWARRGFYQASGAFGFRDQLQDSVNLIWMDPAIARAQILLHASQQFLEGDVVHWFHRLQDGRTGFAARTHASDNLLWLAWAVVEYVGATGDATLLTQRTTYLESELPFEPLPAGKHGMGFDPLRSARGDTVYRHCLRAIDLVLDRRMGAHGLPLIGTGDWNDGLDEIGSQGRGESVWLGFFLYYILERMAGIVGKVEGEARQDHYLGRLRDLGEALESTWRDDRYLRAFHDDGTEIGVKGSGVWEIDALTAAWAVMAGINPRRGRTGFDTALGILEKETTILLGWPPLREDTKPYLGRSSGYPEGVRENGMYCHGVQWLVGAARLLADRFGQEGRPDEATDYAEAAYRLWLKISPLPHVTPDQIETYGGQPNKQAADMVTTFDPGRMIWHGYTGAAGWMFRQALEGVLGLRLVDGIVTHTPGAVTAADLGTTRVDRDLANSPLSSPPTPSEKPIAIEDGWDALPERIV